MGRSLRALSVGAAARQDREQALAEARQVASSTAHSQLEKVAKNLRELLLEDLSTLLAERLNRASPQEQSDSSSSASTSSQDEAPQQPPAASTASRAQSSDEAGLSDVVVSTASKRPVAHRILVGPADTLECARWITLCGWRFGVAGSMRDARPDEPQCHNCFRDGRQSRAEQ